MLQDQILDLLYWVRQVDAVVLGVVLGAAGVEGFMGFIGYIIFVTCLPLIYLNKFLRTNDEMHGGVKAFLMEGSMPSLGLFVLIWTLAYSLLGGGWSPKRSI